MDNINLNIRLTSQKYKVKAIEKETKAKGYADLKIGDEISFACDFVRTTGRSNGGNYALTVEVYRDGVFLVESSQNDLFNRLACFKLVPVYETFK